MSVPNHEKKPFRDMTSEERSSLIEWKLQGGKLQCLSNLGNGDFWAEDCGNCFRIDDTYRTRPYQLVLPWKHIKKEYKWAALDSYGNTCLYKEKPEFMVTDCFASKYGYVDAVKIFNIDTTGIDWRESLTARPEGV